MSHFCLLAASLVAQGKAPGWDLAIPPAAKSDQTPPIAALCQRRKSVAPKASVTQIEQPRPELSPKVRAVVATRPNSLPPLRQPSLLRPTLPRPALPRPTSGSQLYQQRWAALRAGKLYTRIPVSSFQAAWINATRQPTHEQWIDLLAREAQVMARSQGSNRLTVLLGDSISQWFPIDRLSNDRFWLNQSISGDTTAGVLRRLAAFRQTRPDTIYLMVGINDLRRGTSNAVVLNNLRQIVRRLKQNHPQARIITYSILPTRFGIVPGERIHQINQAIANMSYQEGTNFIDLQPIFADARGQLRPELTTDGLHLNANGYDVWRLAMNAVQQ